MSINSDISQLSGISEISMVSSSSSIYQYPLSTTNREYSLDKILNDLAKCEDAICQKAITQLIYECLESLTGNEESLSMLTPEVLDKLEQFIIWHKIQKYLKLPSKDRQNDDRLLLLGIIGAPKPEFNREEKRMIKSVVESRLLHRINSFLTTYEEYGGNLIETMGNNESSARQILSRLNETVLPHWKNKIDEMCNEYHRDIFICSDLLNEWKKLKYDDMEELNLRKAQGKLLEAEISAIQAKLTKITCAIKMFKETPITIEAFRILDQTLEQKIVDTQTEIKRKKSFLKQYEDLRGTEYDDILRRYLDLCSTIEKDERLLNSL